MRVHFYAGAVLVVGTLFAVACWQTGLNEKKDQSASLQRYETLSYHECAVRFAALKDVLSRTPASPRDYFANLGRANMLEGAATKALQHQLPVVLTPEGDRDQIITRDIPRQIDDLVNTYASKRTGLVFMTPAQIAEWQKAQDEFEKSGMDPDNNRSMPSTSEDGNLTRWWLWFQFGAVPFILGHYIIRIRDLGMKVRYELFGNPVAFVLWLIVWEVGLFRYPRKISIMAQLRRAQQWAAFFLTSVLPCLAANAGAGKECEKEPIKWSLTTGTMSNYMGLAAEKLSGHPVQQTSLTVSLPCGVYAGTFNSVSIVHTDDHPNYGNETDVSLGWSGSVKGNAVDISGTYVGLSPVFRLPEDDAFQFSERVSRRLPLGKKAAIAPYAWLREVMPVRGGVVGGWFGHGGAVITRSFGSKLSAALDVATVWDSGALGNNPGFIGTATLTPSWKMGEHVSLQVPLNAQTPLTHTADGRRGVATIGMRVAFNF